MYVFSFTANTPIGRPEKVRTSWTPGKGSKTTSGPGSVSEALAITHGSLIL